jgi:hypothetical protein
MAPPPPPTPTPSPLTTTPSAMLDARYNISNLARRAPTVEVRKPKTIYFNFGKPLGVI